MARAWPAKDVGPLVALIADPRHVMQADGTIRLSEEQAKAILDMRLQRLTALGRDEIADEVDEARRGDQGLSRHPALARRACWRSSATSSAEIRDEFATPRLTELVDADVEIEDEALIEREDVAITVTHAGYIKRTPLAEYRVQGRGGKGRSGMATREEDFVTNHLRRLDPCAAGVLLLHRHGLQAEGLAPARSAHPGQGQGDGEPAAAVGRRAHHHHPAAAGRRGAVGKAQRRVRHQIRRRAAQRAFRFRQHQPQRQDRDEARSRATASSACRSAPIRTTCC